MPPIDPELWAHVEGLIASEDWAKIPAAVATFVEDRVRIWAGDPRQSNNDVLVGKALYTKALNTSGILRMGGQASEAEGWMSLGPQDRGVWLVTKRPRHNGEGSIFPYRNGYAAYVWVTRPDGTRDRKWVYGKERDGGPRQMAEDSSAG